MKRLLCHTVISIALLTGLFSVSGCGQMGPLYLPAEAPDENAAPVSSDDETEQKKD